jgi:hypothetical protein
VPPIFAADTLQGYGDVEQVFLPVGIAVFAIFAGLSPSSRARRRTRSSSTRQSPSAAQEASATSSRWRVATIWPTRPRGTILHKIGGTWYPFASDRDARNYRVYDLRANLRGHLSAPYGTNIPHPMIFPVTEHNRTRYMMVTFDGTQSADPVLGYGTATSLS